MPLVKIIDAQKGDRNYTNQEWYHQHLLHGCWKLTCPYIANNYHPSKYEPLVHPDLNRCLGLLRGPASTGQLTTEIQKWMWSYNQRRPIEQSIEPILCSDFVTKRPERLDITLPKVIPTWLPTLQSMNDYQRLAYEKRRELRELGLLPALAGIAIVNNNRLFKDGVELTEEPFKATQRALELLGYGFSDDEEAPAQQTNNPKIVKSINDEGSLEQSSSQNIETPGVPPQEPKSMSKRQLKRMRRRQHLRRNEQQKRQGNDDAELDPTERPQGLNYQDNSRRQGRRRTSKQVQEEPKHYCLMINDPYDHNKTPNSSRINRPNVVNRIRAIMENPVNNSVILQLPMEHQRSAWEQTIESTPTSVEMNQIQYQCEFTPETLEPSSTATDVRYILPTTYQDPTLLRASLDTQVLDPRERKRQRSRWHNQLKRQNAEGPTEIWPRAEDPIVDSLINDLSLNPPRPKASTTTISEKTRRLMKTINSDSQESKIKAKKPKYHIEEISTGSTSRFRITPVYSEQEQLQKDGTSNPFVAMINSNPAEELPDFTGEIGHDLNDWMEKFERTFNLGKYGNNNDINLRNQAKAHLLQAKLAEPAHSRVKMEIATHHLDYNNFEHLKLALQTLYLNTATSRVALADLSKIHQRTDESVASYANRLSKCIDRAYPGQKPKFLEAKKLEEFQLRLLPQLQVKIFGQKLPTYASALRAAEQIEQAHQAAGLTLESYTTKVGYQHQSRREEQRPTMRGPFEPYNKFNYLQSDRTTETRPIPSRPNVSPEDQRTSTQVEGSNRNQRDRHLSPTTRNRTSSSSDTEAERMMTTMVESSKKRIQFKPSNLNRVLKTSHGKMYYDSNSGPPKQHEPSLSRQPLRSNLKPMDHLRSRGHNYRTFAGHTPPARDRMDSRTPPGYIRPRSPSVNNQSEQPSTSNYQTTPNRSKEGNRYQNRYNSR